jgi:hypothetical protein
VCGVGDGIQGLIGARLVLYHWATHLQRRILRYTLINKARIPFDLNCHSKPSLIFLTHVVVKPPHFYPVLEETAMGDLVSDFTSTVLKFNHSSPLPNI